MSKRFLCLGIVVLTLLLLLPSCKKKDPVTLPTYSEISISPQKDVYQVGDIVRCSIKMQTTGSDNLQKATYWFYANWWFTDPELTADFQEFVTDPETGEMIATSSEIELTEAAVKKTKENEHADLCFYGRLEYPNWDFRKVEIRVPIRVISKN